MATVYGTDFGETIDWGDGTSDGADIIFGFGGNDAIYAYGGNDNIKGGGGADTINGGSGIDTANYGDSTERVVVLLDTGLGYGGYAEGDTLTNIENLTGSMHDDFLEGNTGDNVLAGSDGEDVLKGGGGHDSLYGGDGNDTLKGGGGIDVLNGGSGVDTAAYNASPVGVFIFLDGGTPGGGGTALYGDAEGDRFYGIENLTGSPYADTLWGSSGANVLNGMNGDDDLSGGAGNDILRGEAGTDRLIGGSGADTMVGGTGDDTYSIDDAFDTVTEFAGQGVDTVFTRISLILPAGADVETLRTNLDFGTAAINLTGNSSGNQIIGNDGDNVIDGGGGNDQLAGRAGNDTYIVDSVADTIGESGGQGIDTVRSTVSFTLTAGADVELLATTFDFGDAAIDLTGNANGNTVRGNFGDNVLNGGDGNDQLFGFAGQDSFLFDTPLNATANVDEILDFNATDDTIRLDDAVFTSDLTPGSSVAGSQFVIGAAAGNAGHRIIYDSNTGAVLYDSDGTGAAPAVRFAELAPGLALTNFDFFVV